MRCWIIDTDIGWDPDDILAILLICNYITKKNDKLLIITSDETENNDRAKLVRYIVDNLGHNHIDVVAGHKSLKSPNFAKDLLKISSQIPNNKLCQIDRVIKYIDENNKSTITWIGIGSMTNLNYILKKRDISKIIQMGGCVPDDYSNLEYNIDLDPHSCNEILELASSKYMDLTFVTLDTTGTHPNLLWISNYKDKQDNSKRIVKYINDDIRDNYPSLYEIILLNIKENGYIGSSSLHDPLTVIYALYNIYLFPKVKANISFIDGRWLIKCNLKTKKFQEALFVNGYINGKKTSLKDSIEDIYKLEPNCSISLGCPTDQQVNLFIYKMLELI